MSGITLTSDTYYATGDLYVNAGAIFTLDPGVIIKFAPTRRLEVFGTMNAIGINPAQIIFTSRDDDSIGETIFGSDGVPEPGDWDGILFDGTSTNDGICQMEYCQVLYGGSVAGAVTANIFFEESDPGYFRYGYVSYSEWFGIAISDCDPEISVSDIMYNDYYAVYIELVCSPDINGNNISSNNDIALYIGTSDATPVISSNIFDNNHSYPIDCNSTHVNYITGNSFSGNTYQQIYVNSVLLSEDATWTDQNIPYLIDGDLFVQGQDGPDLVTTLMIESGCTLEFGSYYGLIIGHDSNSNYPGALIANGTEPNPITFTSASGSPSSGDWDGIYFANYSADATCLLNYCIIEYGGYFSNENIYCNYSSPTITNCDISRSSGSGIYCNQANPIITGSGIHHNTSYGIYCNSNSNPTISGSSVTHNSSYGIYVYGSSAPTISGCDISNNGNMGIYVNSAGDDPTISGNTINNNSSYPLRCYAGHVGNSTGNSFSGNTYQQIYVYGETITEDATWENQGIPYYVSSASHIYVQGTDGGDGITTLTLNPGVELDFDSVFLWIGHNSNPAYNGALVADGTGPEPIIFTSNSATPAAGDWYGIYFADYADDSTCLLDHCIIEYGGATASYENVYCNSSSPTITNCEISYGDGAGIFFENSTISLSNCNIHHNTTRGIDAYYSSLILNLCDLNNNTSSGFYLYTSDATITNSDFDNNSGYGIYSYSSNVNISGSFVTFNGSYGIYSYNGSELYLSSSTVSSNGNIGVYIGGSSDYLEMSSNSIDNNSNYPVRCYAGQVGNMTGNTFYGNSYQQIYVYGETIIEDATWENQGIPYFISSAAHIYVQGTDGPDGITTLIIEPGNELDFDSTFLYIGHNSNPAYNGALIADGTEAEPILFTSNSGTPAAGDWYGIYFADYSDDNTCIIDNCIIEYGGNGSYDNIYCVNSSPVISNSVIRNGDGVGISTENSSSQISDCEIYNNTMIGIYAVQSSLDISRCLVYDNPDYGISNDNTPSNTQISHCTITGSDVGFSAMGNSTTIIHNSIIWGNSSLGVDIGFGSTLTMTYSDCQNPWTGTGNISFNPDFRDEFNDDYYLLYSSPCIDTGDPASPLDPDGTIADMGVYYFDKSDGSPAISSISDVPDDQGRQVQIVWDRSSYDALGSPVPIEDYSIWRYDEIFRNSGKMNVYNDPAEIFAAAEEDTDKKLYWQRDDEILTFIDFVFAMGFEQYSAIAPTLHDSSAVSTHYSKYIIYAHTDVTLMYFASEPDSGYSLDNIPPIATRVDIVRDGSNMNLSWDEVEYGEFEGNLYPEVNGIWYKVYAGDIPDFDCDAGHLIDTVTDLEYDYPIGVEDKKFFKIVVSDKQ